ncbi:MAG: segregation/condensation protein A [Sphaerochaetaceae bacterium]|nr:segregation/condensation protein A [Sphaerochaetaceae bacterium]
MADTDDKPLLEEMAQPGKSFKTPVFEGPLDLLLYLIQKSEINIYDIPISEITDQFLEYLNQAEQLDLGDLTDFYKMAADLLYIKSRMLLPVEVDFDEEYADPRQELVERLIEYQKFKKYTDLLSNTEQNGELYISRRPTQFMLPFDDQELWSNVSVQDLLHTFAKLLKSITPSKVFNVYEEVTVNEKITLMTELFETHEVIHLIDVIVHPEEPLHIICAFMAILESTKFKMILIEQPEPFGDIVIRRRSQDFDQNLADEYDEEYDDAVEHGFDDEDDKDDFSILHDPDEAGTDDEENAIVYEYGEEDEEDILVGDDEGDGDGEDDL